MLPVAIGLIYLEGPLNCIERIITCIKDSVATRAASSFRDIFHRLSLRIQTGMYGHTGRGALYLSSTQVEIIVLSA